MSSDTVVGHEDKVRAFTKLAQEDRLGHAYLFFGDMQVGKHAFARALAHFLERGTFTVSEAPLIDVMWSAPTEGAIGIDEVRALRRFLSQTPLRSSRRVAVVDDAHLLTPEAQSGMLKIMEEPPSRSLIILIAHEPTSLLPPLLSRLVKIYFPRFSSAELIEVLAQSFHVPAARARELALRSFGRLGRALSFLEQERDEVPDTFEAELEKRILALWERGAEAHSSSLAYLLDRETYCKRYNLNENLQRKAVRAHLS